MAISSFSDFVIDFYMKLILYVRVVFKNTVCVFVDDFKIKIWLLVLHTCLVFPGSNKEIIGVTLPYLAMLIPCGCFSFHSVKHENEAT